MPKKSLNTPHMPHIVDEMIRLESGVFGRKVRIWLTDQEILGWPKMSATQVYCLRHMLINALQLEVKFPSDGPNLHEAIVRPGSGPVAAVKTNELRKEYAELSKKPFPGGRGFQQAHLARLAYLERMLNIGTCACCGRQRELDEDDLCIDFSNCSGL